MNVFDQLAGTEYRGHCTKQRSAEVDLVLL